MPKQNTPADMLKRAEAAQPTTPTQQIGWVSLPLPSRGLLYGGKMPGGLVQQRKMMSGEMARLQTQGGNVLEKIEAIVNACTRLPDGINAKELLLTDSFFLMLALRTRTFGPEYKFTFRCQFCGAIEKAEVNVVEDLDEKVGDEDLVEPLEVPLPDAGCVVSGRFLRMSDQDLITKYTKRVRLTSTDHTDPAYQYRLALTLVALDGEPFSDLLKKQDFVKGLTASDCLKYERTLIKRESGVDIRIHPECGTCGASNEMALPFDAEFFRPTSL